MANKANKMPPTPELDKAVERLTLLNHSQLTT